MRKNLSIIIQLLVFVGLGVWIIFYMSSQMTELEKAEMVASIKTTRVWLFLPVLIIGILSHYFRALRWKLMLEPMGIRPSTLITTMAVLVGYFANLLLPRMGEVAKCTVLAKNENVPADKMVGTIVAERLFDVLCLGAVVLITLFLEGHIIGDFAKEKLGHIADSKNTILAIGGMGVLLLIALALFVRKFQDNKISKVLKGIGEGISSILILNKKGLFFLYSFLIWFMYLLQVQIGFWSLPSTEHLGLSVALSVLVFGSIGMIATQGGIGAYTYLIAQILVFYDISKPDGTAFGWVSWLVQSGIVFVLGLASLILIPLIKKRRNGKISLDQKQDL